MACCTELFHQALMRVLRGFLKDDWIPLLGRNLKMTIGL